MFLFSVITGKVVRIIKDTADLQEVAVDVGATSEHRAYNYPGLFKRLEVGDEVRLNSAAVELALGTGGRHFVLPQYPERLSVDFPGHIMKMRYTPWQMPVLSGEAVESPYHEKAQSFQTLDGTPVVAASLHSMLPGIILGFRAGFRGENPPKIVYIMTDGAALPAAFSNMVKDLKEKNLLDLVITAGNAFGGDVEAIGIPSALALAKTVLNPDLIITSLGPGIAGTDTKFGFSGVDQSWVLDLTAKLGGIPIIVPRISEADKRERHLGLSHHTVTILQLVSNSVKIPVSQHLSANSLKRLTDVLNKENLMSANEFCKVADPIASQLFETAGINPTTMGRGLDSERDFFQTTVAAGFLAAETVDYTR